MFRVWIVDDEPLVSDRLSRQIDWESLNMVLAGTTTNGLDVLSALADQSAHLLITDVSMPQIDGLTLISKAKLLCPSIRCIIISAYNEFEYVKKALQSGVENYLLKPINENELHDTLSKTLENLNRDQLVLSHDSPDVLAFRTNILDRWVNGAIQDFELDERAELLKIYLSAPEYTVCVLEIIQPEDKHSKFKHSSVLLEICRSTFHSFGEECFLDGSFRVVAILHERSSSAKLKEELPSLLQKMAEEALARGIRLFSSLGPVARTFTNVSASYLSALFHLNYRFLDPSAAVASSGYSDPQGGSPDDVELVIQFNKALKDGSLGQASSLADKFIRRHGDVSYDSVRRGVILLALSLVRTMTESGRISEALPPETNAYLAKFTENKSIGDLKMWLTQLIDESMRVIRDRNGSYHLFIHRTLEQVNRKYATELSLKTLAAGFNVSPAYLGQLFKEETGKYFNDYLTEVRLQTSRSLLLETNLKINEIVQRIGIPNQSYFNRVFKKTYDISPMEFRRQSLKP